MDFGSKITAIISRNFTRTHKNISTWRQNQSNWPSFGRHFSRSFSPLCKFLSFNLKVHLRTDWQHQVFFSTSICYAGSSFIDWDKKCIYGTRLLIFAHLWKSSVVVWYIYIENLGTWSFERSFNIFDIQHKKCTFEGTNWSFLPEIFFVTVYIATKSKTSWWWSIQIIAISTFTKMIILERKKEKKQQKRRKNPHFSKVSFLNNAPWVCSHTTWYSILSL